MYMSTMLSRVSTVDAVVNYFFDQIQQGLLTPGAALPSERSLQLMLGISRFTLREGLARLSALGISEVKHGKGAFLATTVNTTSLRHVFLPLFAQQNIKHLNDLFDARCAIEVEVASLAARQCTEDDVHSLREAHRQTTLHLQTPEAFAVADVHFHRTIADVAGNSTLEVGNH